jgi:hypothetical protein
MIQGLESLHTINPTPSYQRTKNLARNKYRLLHRISAYITTLQNSKSTNSKELAEKKFIEDSFILDLAKALHHHIEAYDSLYSEDFVAAGFE